MLSAGIEMVMPVPSSIGTMLWLKCHPCALDLNPKMTQHVTQHGIKFQMQIIQPDLDWHMTVTQVIGCAKQVARMACGDTQHFLFVCHHLNKSSILCHQHITPSHDGTSGQDDRDFLSCGEGGS